MTGTPIQNKLTDFASIVKFLQVYPYSDPKVFEEEISKPWRNRHGLDPQGFLRLKMLVRAITISRSKAVVQLPPRNDEVHHLDFAPAEREKYEAAKIQSRALLEDAISSGNERGKTFNALWLLNILRLICSHGLLAQSTPGKTVSQISQDAFISPSQNLANDSFDGDILSGAATCSNCGANLLEELLEGSPSAEIDEQRPIAPCGPLLCELCRSQLGNSDVGSMPWLQSVPVENAVSAGSRSATPAKDCNEASRIDCMSTKIKALVADIFKYSATEKRSVHNSNPFSQC